MLDQDQHHDDLINRGILNPFQPIKFGDTQLIEKLKRQQKHKLETTKVTIDLKRLLKIGVERNQALDLIERLIKK